MKATANPYDLPAVLVITDVARALRTSVTSIRRHLRQGTFPIRPMTTPIIAIGLDKKYRWARRDLEQFLNGGFRASTRGHVRLRLSA